MNMQTSAAAMAAASLAEPADFTSIVLTLDHLQQDVPEGVRAFKFVCSTQTVNETMIALFAYYGISQLLAEPSTIETFQEAAAAVGLPVFILHTNVNTQVVTDADTWAVLLNYFGGSMLSATEALEDMVVNHLRLQKQIQGGIPTLSLFMFSSEDVDVPEGVEREGETRQQQQGETGAPVDQPEEAPAE